MLLFPLNSAQETFIVPRLVLRALFKTSLVVSELILPIYTFYTDYTPCLFRFQQLEQSLYYLTLYIPSQT